MNDVSAWQTTIGLVGIGAARQEVAHDGRVPVVGGEHEQAVAGGIGQREGYSCVEVPDEGRAVALPGRIEQRMSQGYRGCSAVIDTWPCVGRVLVVPRAHRGAFRKPVARPTTCPASGATMTSWPAAYRSSPSCTSRSAEASTERLRMAGRPACLGGYDDCLGRLS